MHNIIKNIIIYTYYTNVLRTYLQMLTLAIKFNTDSLFVRTTSNFIIFEHFFEIPMFLKL